MGSNGVASALTDTAAQLIVALLELSAANNWMQGIWA